MAIDVSRQFSHWAPLYHATDADLKPGDVIEPGAAAGRTGPVMSLPSSEAFAAESPQEASGYGPKTYRVAHIDDPYKDIPEKKGDLHEPWGADKQTEAWANNRGNNVVSSTRGFRVIGRLEDEETPTKSDQ